jgi:hypothetical protein
MNRTRQRLRGGLITGGSPPAFTPASLSPRAWWDATDAATITDSGSGAVSQLNDKSGNLYHLVQGTGALRPTTGTRTLYSLNALDFSTDRLAVASIGTVTQPYTVYITAAHDVTTGSQYMMDSASGGRAGFLITTATWRSFAGTLLADGAADTSPHVFKIFFNGASSTIGIDGTTVATGNAGAGVPTGWVLGSDQSATFSFDGLIRECVIIDGAVTGTNDTNMQTYMSRTS